MSFVERLLPWRNTKEATPERLKPGQLRHWIESAIQGDEEAIEQIHAYIGPRLRKQVDSLLPPQKKEAIFQAALAKIDQNLDNFDPNKKPRNFNVNFRRWSSIVATNLVIDVYRQQHRKPPKPSPERYHPKTISEIIPQYEQKVDLVLDALPPKRQEVVRLILAGQNTVEVSRTLGIDPRAVRQRLHHSRSVIEETLIAPFGLIQTCQLDNPQLIEAADNDRLEKVKFLGRWYTTQEAIERFYLPPLPRGLARLIPESLRRFGGQKQLGFLPHH